MFAIVLRGNSTYAILFVISISLPELETFISKNSLSAFLNSEMSNDKFKDSCKNYAYIF